MEIPDIISEKPVDNLSFDAFEKELLRIFETEKEEAFNSVVFKLRDQEISFLPSPKKKRSLIPDVIKFWKR